MSADAPTRPKFDTLLADPRHYRGDLRLLRTAIRQGWVREEDLQALAARYNEAVLERQATDPEMKKVRSWLAGCEATMWLANRNLGLISRGLRYTRGGWPTGQTTGRPRRRAWVSDCPRIAVADLVAQPSRDGSPWLGADGPLQVTATWHDGDGKSHIAHLQAVRVVERSGWRLWLVCPGCAERRAYLYLTIVGFRCRPCGRVRYGDRIGK